MSGFRDKKNRLLESLASDDWQNSAPVENKEEAISYLSPLLAMLPRPELRFRAAHCLSKTLKVLDSSSREEARNLMRRLMWSMNEESGNLGWGIPETMATIIVDIPSLGAEYERILLSYVMITGKDDNYIDHGPLRLGVYWGIGHIARNRKKAFTEALPWLNKSMDIENELACRGMAAWALSQLASWYIEHDEKISSEDLEEWKKSSRSIIELEKLFSKGDSFEANPPLEIFENLKLETISCSQAVEIARKAVSKIL